MVGKVGGEDVVLQGDRDTVQRAANFALGSFPIAFDGLFDGFGIDCESGVEFVFVGGDADEVLRDEFPGGNAPLLHGGPHVGYGGFFDLEGGVGLRG